jgi:hypothetical protein
VAEKVRAWDFGAAKGTGASVVDYDPKADLSSGLGPTEPRLPGMRVKEAEVEDTEYILRFWRIPKAEALKVAYHLVITDRQREVPHDIRVAVSRLVRRIGGSQRLSDRVLNGEFDNVIATLLK